MSYGTWAGGSETVLIDQSLLTNPFSFRRELLATTLHNDSGTARAILQGVYDEWVDGRRESRDRETARENKECESERQDKKAAARDACFGILAACMDEMRCPCGTTSSRHETRIGTGVFEGWLFI